MNFQGANRVAHHGVIWGVSRGSEGTCHRRAHWEQRHRGEHAVHPDGNGIMQFHCLGFAKDGGPYDGGGGAWSFLEKKGTTICTFSGVPLPSLQWILPCYFASQNPNPTLIPCGGCWFLRWTRRCTNGSEWGTQWAWILGFFVEICSNRCFCFLYFVAWYFVVKILLVHIYSFIQLVFI